MTHGLGQDLARLPMSRRSVVFALSGAGAIVLRPAIGPAQPLASGHQPILDVPKLAEDPTAVPVRVSVDHPMTRDHFIESVELILEADPVPHKGTYRFTAANGRAGVSFPMRSGAGGLLKAIATCNRHGRFIGTREVRVGGDGCASESDGWRGRPAKPRIRIMGAPKIGEIVEVATRLDHVSDTGLQVKDGKYTRVRPEFFVRRMQVFLGDQRISDFQLTSALSSNAIVRFPVRVTSASMLRVVVVNSEGRRWEAAERIRLDA
jgi:desulfoferrodoxin (superoxide reductase-like protein)